MTLPPSHAADSLRPIDLPATDRALRDDVNRVGALVGEILAEQEGEAFLDEVERIRVAAIARRASGAGIENMARELSAVDVAHATSLVRAFSTYFQAVNVAERVHRIRRRREYERAEASPQPGGLRQVVAALREGGVGADALHDCLQRLCIE